MDDIEFQKLQKLPPAQRKAIQQKLKEQGFYFGEVDGDLGAGTRSAFDLRDKAEEEKANRDRVGRTAEIQAEAKAAKDKAEADRILAEAEAERLRTAQSQQYGEQANSPEGVATKIAANTVAPLTGVAVGRSMGSGINKLADMSQSSRNQALQGAAIDRIEGRTTREGARVGTERSGAMPSRNSALRVGGRMLPHSISGAAMIGKGGAMLSDEGGEAFYADQANRAAGLGMIGTGAGLFERGAAYAINPGVSPDARSIAIMESNQLRRSPAAQAQVNRLLQAQDAPPAAQPPAPRALAAPQNKPSQPPQQHSARLANAVSAVGGKPSKSKSANYQALQKSINDGNAAEVAKALNLPEGTPRRTIMQRARELVNTRGVSSWALPFAAGAFAYSMTPEEAQASTGGQETQPFPRENAYSGSPDDDFAYGQGTPSGGLNEEALTNAGIVTGLTYGMNRLIPRGTGALIGGAMGPVAAMTGPDFTPETEKFAANAAVRDMPWLRHVLPGRQEAYDMAQVPERNPARVYENAYAPGGQPSGYGQPQKPDSFDADIAELQRLLSAMEAEGGQPMPQPQFRVPPPATGPQNRLLAVR